MMLKNTRLLYFILMVSAIILGIASRKIDGVPAFFGDALYSVMVYFGIRLLFINYSPKKTMLFALIFCFGIELLQLYRAEWILAIRRTNMGHYALGQGFLWSDLVFYTLGITIAFLIDSNWIKRN